MEKSVLLLSEGADQRLHLLELPQWVERSIARKILSGRLVIVSAVCPDYERDMGGFTYRGIGGGVPYIAARHLEVIEAISIILGRKDISLEYHITLADTEFDLPLVVKHMVAGDTRAFLDRCEASCAALRSTGVKIGHCERFTSIFPDWFSVYEEARNIILQEVGNNPSVRADMELSAFKRKPLYDAMVGHDVGIAYAEEMVVRQWAQYMAWGVCAEQKFGSFVMMNHSTPNLSRVNHPAFRRGRERIPILQLKLTTMPGE